MKAVCLCSRQAIRWHSVCNSSSTSVEGVPEGVSASSVWACSSKEEHRSHKLRDGISTFSAPTSSTWPPDVYLEHGVSAAVRRGSSPRVNRFDSCSRMAQNQQPSEEVVWVIGRPERSPRTRTGRLRVLMVKTQEAQKLTIRQARPLRAPSCSVSIVAECSRLLTDQS